MALRREITSRITDLLHKNPQGLSITEIVKHGGINRNTAGRYLDNLLVTGQVEMRHFGMAKIYSLSSRLPVSSVLAISTELVLQLDASLRIVFLNQPFISLLESTEKELVGKNIEFSKIPLFFDETFPTVLAWIRDGIAGTEYRGELDIPKEKKVFSCRVVPTVFNSGQKGVSILFDDITEQKQSEALLSESEELFRTLVNNANDLILLLKQEKEGVPGRFLEVNHEACRVLQYTREELLSLAPEAIVAPERAAVLSRNARVLRERGHATFEMELVSKEGRRIPVEVNAHIFEFRGESVVLALVRDITERREAEEQLRLLKISVDSAYDEVFWMDLQGAILYVNDAACRTTGYSQNELCAMNISDLVPDLTPEQWKEHFLDVRERKAQFFLSRHRRKDGVIIDVEVGSVYVARGDKEYKFCFVREITERNRVEAALRESEARYRSLAEASQDLIFVIDQNDTVLYINQRAADFLRKPAAAVIGHPRSANFPKEVSDHQYQALQHIFATGKPVRSEGPMNLWGERRWFDHALVPIPDAEGKITSVLGVSREITTRIVAEQERQQNEQTNRFIAEHSVDIIHRLTPDCVCTYASPSVTPVLGYTQEDLAGTSVLSMIHPDDLPGVLEDLATIRTSGQDTATSSFRFRHKDGRYLWFESTTRVVRDASGQVKEFLNISRDITGRKNGPSAPDKP